MIGHCQTKEKGNSLNYLAVLAVTLVLAGCTTIATPPPLPAPPPAPPFPTPPPAANLVDLSALPGWETMDTSMALEALRADCLYKKGVNLGTVCKDMQGQTLGTPQDIKTFLLAHFKAKPIAGEGLLTSYFVPEYRASTTMSAEFSQGVRTRPADLEIIDGAKMTPPSPASKIAARKVGDQYLPYYTRAQIEAMPYDGHVFMRPEDYFYMQLQGSGYLTFADGSQILAAYASDNGQPFVGIAKPMVEQGLLTKDQASGDNIRAWLASHRGDEARAIMNLNPRYAFFVIESSLHEPVGAANVPLPAGAAIAIDPLFHNYGELIWIDADSGNLSGAFPKYQRLVASLDTGGAIKGNIRADLYMGRGERAGLEAGRVRHKLRMWKIVPN